jgi:anti-anti-sigma factor
VAPRRTEYRAGIVAFDEQPAVLRCSGDEDLATQGARRRALARALKVHADLVVDLSELSFADASLMVDLATLALRLRQRGRRLLLRSPQPHIRRLIEMVGLHRQPGVAFA